MAHNGLIAQLFLHALNNKDIAKPGLSLIHFNARSLSSGFNLVSNFLTELNLNFDIIAISETWLNTQIEGDYNIKGHDAYHKVRDVYKIGGGVV